MKKLILASTSPRRHKLLEQLGLEFTTFAPDISETIEPGLHPEEIVKQLAERKAMTCCRKFQDSLIIGADTLVVLDGCILGKPDDKKQASEMLSRLSGRTHSVYTGIALLLTDTSSELTHCKIFHEQTKVTFDSLTSQEIEDYVASGSPLDKAGAYGIQDDMGSVFVSGVTGDFYNVVGLPVHRLYRQLQEIAPEVFRRSFKKNVL